MTRGCKQGSGWAKKEFNKASKLCRMVLLKRDYVLSKWGNNDLLTGERHKDSDLFDGDIVGFCDFLIYPQVFQRLRDRIEGSGRWRPATTFSAHLTYRASAAICLSRTPIAPRNSLTSRCHRLISRHNSRSMAASVRSVRNDEVNGSSEARPRGSQLERLP
jgi:hypothetical protein